MAVGSPKEEDWPASLEECYRAVRSDGAVNLQAESLLGMRHWFHELAEFDERSGQMLPGPLGGVCARALECSCAEPIAPTKDRLYRILVHVREPIAEITSRLHERLIREHAAMPLRAVRELDSASFFALSRRSGRTIREKLAAKPYLWAVNRRWTVDTVENKLFKALCLRLAELLRARAECFRESDQAEVAETLAIIDSWLHASAAAEIGPWENLPPNNMLLQHRSYRRIWDAWLWAQTIDVDMQRDHQNRLAHWMTLLFWSIVSRMSRLAGIRLVEQPCYFDYDAFSLHPALGSGNNLSVEGMLLPYLIPNPTAASASKNSADEKGGGHGLVLAADGRSVLGDRRSSQNGRVLERVEFGTKVRFKVRKARGRLEATEFVILQTPGSFGVELTPNLEIRLSLDGARPVLLRVDGQGGAEEIRIRMGPNSYSSEMHPRGAAQVAESVLHALFPRRAGADVNAQPERDLPVLEEGLSGVVDLCALRPRLAYGEHESLLPFRLLWQLWQQLDRDAVEIDLAGSGGISLSPDSTAVSILNLVTDRPPMSMAVLSQAARFFAKKLRGLLPTDALTYLVPDATDDFSLDTLRRNVNASFRSAEPLPRSIAAVFDWHSSSGFQKRRIAEGDCVVVLDSVGRTLSATPLIASHSEKLERRLSASGGIQWERCPSVQAECRLASTGLATDVLQECGCSFGESVARLVGFQGLLDEGIQVSWQDGEGRWYTAPPNIDGVCRKARQEMDDPWPLLLRGMEQQFHCLRRGARVFILTVGDIFDGPMCPLPPTHALDGRRAAYVGHARRTVHGGKVLHEWQAKAGDIPLWRDQLPELSIRIIRDGRYERFYLVKDKTIRPRRGEAVPIEIRDTFVLPAGRPHYQFPLLQGSEGSELQYEAYLKSSAFPLREDVEVALHLTYSYGSDTPYDLVFTPRQEKGDRFRPVRAEWRLRTDSPHETALCPSFPAPPSWEALERFPKRDSDETSNLLTWIRDDLDRLERRFDMLADRERHTGKVPAEGWRQDRNDELSTFAKGASGSLFCHAREFLDRPDAAAIVPGETLSFEIEEGHKGPFASWIVVGESLAPEIRQRIRMQKVRKIVETMRKGLRFPFLTVWSAGHTLTEAAVPSEFRETMQQGLAILRRVLRPWDAVDWPPEDAALLTEVRDEGLFLLCCLHRDAPSEVAQVLRSCIASTGDSQLRLRDCVRHIGLAIGGADLAWQRELMESVLQILAHDDPQAWSDCLQILSTALWRSEYLLDKLSQPELERIFTVLLSSLQEDAEAPVHEYKEKNGWYVPRRVALKLELLLALLRTRESPDDAIRSLLAIGNMRTGEYERVVDVMSSRIGTADAVLHSRIAISVDKPPALHNMPDLLFALMLYLTGDSGARAIQVTGVADDEE